jgi:hypothetical protein
MLERTAYKVYPIIESICSKLVKDKNQEESEEEGPKPPTEKSVDSACSLDNMTINMKALLGYLN